MESEIIEIMNNAFKIIEMCDGHICSRCLGRNFSKTVQGDGNLERGEYVRHLLSENAPEVSSEVSSEVSKDLVSAGSPNPCYVCNGLLDEIDATENSTTDKIIKRIDESKIEFSNFLVGCRVDPEILNREKEIHDALDLDVENIKKEINREIGKDLSIRLDREVEFDNPHLVVMVDFKNENIELQTNPLFIEGRYRKLVRGIPQTKWPCTACKGRGCERCNYTGKMYLETVEEFISKDALEMTNGTSAKFHGAGREDIDVKMLGSGRPFVLEIKEPHIRSIDLEELENRVNQHAEGKVEVLNLKFVGKNRRSQIKTSSTDTYKVYRALVQTEGDVAKEDLEPLKSLDVIKQRTPIRVSHRRADKIRTRHVKNLEFKRLDSNLFELLIHCEGGLYIKELISGDEDRTNPSVSQVIGTPAVCKKLDVMEVNI